MRRDSAFFLLLYKYIFVLLMGVVKFVNWKKGEILQEYHFYVKEGRELFRHSCCGLWIQSQLLGWKWTLHSCEPYYYQTFRNKRRKTNSTLWLHAARMPVANSTLWLHAARMPVAQPTFHTPAAPPCLSWKQCCHQCLFWSILVALSQRQA